MQRLRKLRPGSAILIAGLVLLCFMVVSAPPAGAQVYDTLPAEQGPIAPILAPLAQITASVSAQPGTDVNVSNLTGDESEVSIDVNPTDRNNLVIVGHEQDFDTMNTFYSLDGGQTWTLVALGNADDGLTSGFRFDPTLAFDDNGNLYVAYGVRTTDTSGTRQSTVVVCRSTDGGQTYSQFVLLDTNAYIGNLPGNDKWHLATGPDPSNPAVQDVYIAWTKNVVEGVSVDQRIVVSRSTDGGATFSAPLIINDPSIAGTRPGNLFADPAVGPNGELYVAWHDIDAGEVYVDVSTDGGATFGTDILVTTSGAGFATLIPAQPDRGVSVGPTIDVDRTGGTYDGRLYITYVDTGAGGVPDMDVFVRYSDDSGATWSSPTLVNDDGGTNSQFLPWLDVDQQLGLVLVAWYDARNDTNNKKVELFAAVSDDGGATFAPNIPVSDGQSDQSVDNPNRTGNNYLEYIGIVGYGCEASMVWADNSTNLADLDYFSDTIALSATETILCNNAPICDAGDSYTVECQGASTTLQLDGTGSTDEFPDTLTFLWTSDCPSWSFDDATSATPMLTIDTSSGCGVTCNVTLRVTDALGGFSECVATVKVVDTTPPVLVCPADTVIECDESTGPTNTGVATATDTCDSSPVVSFSDVLTPGACAQEYTIQRTWTATDNCGNVASCTQTIEVVDTTPPVISCNAPATITPPDAPISFTATAVDNCDPAVSAEIIEYDCYFLTANGKRIDKTDSCIVQVAGDTITILDSGGVGTHITWTVQSTDDCGNVSQAGCEVEVVNPGNH